MMVHSTTSRGRSTGSAGEFYSAEAFLRNMIRLDLLVAGNWQRPGQRYAGGKAIEPNQNGLLDSQPRLVSHGRRGLFNFRFYLGHIKR